MAKEGKSGEEIIQQPPAETMGGLFSEKANKLMKIYGKGLVFRCPETGQWFTSEDLAKNYSKQTNIKLEIYKNE